MELERKALTAILGLILSGLACSIGGSITTPTPNNAPMPPAVLQVTTVLAPTPTFLTIIDTDTAIPTLTSTVAASPTATFIPLPGIGPTGTPPASQCNVALAQAGNWVKVRSGPGFNYDTIAVLESYTTVIGSNGTWYEIPLFFGGTGWVASSVTKLVGPCQAIPTVVFTPNPSR